MERRQLRRAAYVTAGLVVIAGAVVVLKSADKPVTQAPPQPPPQSSVRQHAADGVVLPQATDRPPPVGKLDLRPGPHRLQIRWNGRAAGFEVRLRGGGGVERTKLVAEQAAQFDGLDNAAEYQIEVRAVDAFGQRSDPAKANARPDSRRGDESNYTFVDHFDSPFTPDPARWRLAANVNCAQAGRGLGDDGRRLVIHAACGADSVALRSRTPFVRRTTGEELGRLMVETDAPGHSGELLLDLVPGPVDLIEGSRPSTQVAPQAGVAQVDPDLPPGAIRVRVSGSDVQVLVALNTPSTGRKVDVAKPAPPLTGVSARWEVVLRTDGVHVLRDGVLVGAGDVVPAWTEATALVGFSGPANGRTYVALDALGLTSAATPLLVPPPAVNFISAAEPGQRTELFAGATGAQARITVRPNHGASHKGTFHVELAGRRFPARPAIAGQPLTSGVRYPLVADLPADALVLTGDRRELKMTVGGDDAFAVQHVGIEFTPDPATGPSSPQAASPATLTPRSGSALAQVNGMLLDTAGRSIENPTLGRRSRVLLEISMDGVTSQRVSGELAGLAGIEVWVDDKRIAGVPTTKDGPAVAGTWRLALNTAVFEPGIRKLEIKAIAADGVTPPATAYVPMTITD